MVSIIFATIYAPSIQPEILANSSMTLSLTSFLRVSFSVILVIKIVKQGPQAAADQVNKKNVQGQTKIPSRNPKGRANSTPGTPPRDPWWKKERKAPVAAKTAMISCML